MSAAFLGNEIGKAAQKAAHIEMLMVAANNNLYHGMLNVLRCAFAGNPIQPAA